LSFIHKRITMQFLSGSCKHTHSTCWVLARGTIELFLRHHQEPVVKRAVFWIRRKTNRR